MCLGWEDKYIYIYIYIYIYCKADKYDIYIYTARQTSIEKSRHIETSIAANIFYTWIPYIQIPLILIVSVVTSTSEIHAFPNIYVCAYVYISDPLTLFRMGVFGAAHGWVGQIVPPSLKSVTHILQWWDLAQLYIT